MANILVPVHSGQDAQWVTRYLLKLYQSERVRVHLLSVQPKYSGAVGLFFSQKDIADFHEEDGAHALAPMRKILDATGIPYNAHCVIGDTVEEIARFAREHYCPQIVIGPDKKNNWLNLILGSLTRRVAVLMQATSNKSSQVL